MHHTTGKKPSAVRLSRRGVIRSGAALGAVSLFNIGGRAQAAASGTVTFFTSMPGQYAEPVINAFNKLDNGVKVEIFYGPTYQVLERLEAELRSGRISADMVMLADPGPYLDFKARGELLDYVSPHVEHYPADQRDTDGLWVNGRTMSNVLAYNTGLISADEAPTSWAEFADSKWAGKTGIIDVRVGGTGYTWYYVTRNHPDLGVNFWKALAAQKPQMARGHGALMDKTSSGELPMTEQLDYSVYSAMTKKNAPVMDVYPSEVIPVTLSPIAILKRGPNIEAAKVFYDWWLSKPGQEIVRDANGSYSPRLDVDPLPGKKPFSELSRMDYDLVDFNAQRETLQAEFIEIFQL